MTLVLGTYLGPADDATDAAYRGAIRAFLDGGGKTFDTAANYREGRSEYLLGATLVDVPDAFVSTKVGYLPMGDGTPGERPAQWFQRVLREPGILDPSEVVDGCHALAPRYLAHQAAHSLAALRRPRLDLLHLHNPEQQRPHLTDEAFHLRLRQAFEACEAMRSEGRVEAYGIATWAGLRVGPEHPQHLSLERLLTLAREVGGPDHGLRWIQCPLNLAMPEAFLLPTQRLGSHPMTILEVAQARGLSVQTSASLLQGKLLGRLPEAVLDALGAPSEALAALQFARSCPGVTHVLCGMASADHVQANAAVERLPPVPEATLRGLFRP